MRIYTVAQLIEKGRRFNELHPYRQHPPSPKPPFILIVGELEVSISAPDNSVCDLKGHYLNDDYNIKPGSVVIVERMNDNYYVYDKRGIAL
jgi:hypothetical protein